MDLYNILKKLILTYVLADFGCRHLKKNKTHALYIRSKTLKEKHKSKLEGMWRKGNEMQRIVD